MLTWKSKLVCKIETMHRPPNMLRVWVSYQTDRRLFYSCAQETSIMELGKFLAVVPGIIPLFPYHMGCKVKLKWFQLIYPALFVVPDKRVFIYEWILHRCLASWECPVRIVLSARLWLVPGVMWHNFIRGHILKASSAVVRWLWPGSSTHSWM